MGGLPHHRLETRPLQFRCSCSREKVERALRSLGSAELREMLAQEGGARVTCEFCCQDFELAGEELARLAEH
jgi:molecular chaperone Hsp33